MLKPVQSVCSNLGFDRLDTNAFQNIHISHPMIPFSFVDPNLKCVGLNFAVFPDIVKLIGSTRNFPDTCSKFRSIVPILEIFTPRYVKSLTYFTSEPSTLNSNVDCTFTLTQRPAWAAYLHRRSVVS